jgi:hypothetical protein
VEAHIEDASVRVNREVHVTLTLPHARLANNGFSGGSLSTYLIRPHPGSFTYGPTACAPPWGIRGDGAIVAQGDGEDVVKELKKDDLSPAFSV